MPSVSVITSAFTRAAHARAAALGMPDVRLVVLPSPLAPRSVAEVQRLAQTYAPAIVGLLSPREGGRASPPPGGAP